jgi:hypothetical protein
MGLMMANRLSFFVSAAGVQMDCLATEDYEDFSLTGTNRVWLGG